MMYSSIPTHMMASLPNMHPATGAGDLVKPMVLCWRLLVVDHDVGIILNCLPPHLTPPLLLPVQELYWVTSSFQLTHPEEGDKNLH